MSRLKGLSSLTNQNVLGDDPVILRSVRHFCLWWKKLLNWLLWRLRARLSMRRQREWKNYDTLRCGKTLVVRGHGEINLVSCAALLFSRQSSPIIVPSVVEQQCRSSLFHRIISKVNARATVILLLVTLRLRQGISGRLAASLYGRSISAVYCGLTSRAVSSVFCSEGSVTGKSTLQKLDFNFILWLI